MSGPYGTEREVRREPMPLAVAALHAAGLVRSGDPDGLVRRAQMSALVEACEAAGVALGGYDLRVLDWLAGWESTTVQVVADVIRRAGSGGHRS